MPFGMNVDIKAHNRMFFVLEDENATDWFRLVTGIGL